jgi:DNA replication licensing factor MCM4
VFKIPLQRLSFFLQSYAKQSFNPKLTDEAGNELIQSYVKMRQIGSGRGQITAFPRQLESLIRLAEAHAKMRFSNTVDLVRRCS